jgi:DNA ligase (NAD+)
VKRATLHNLDDIIRKDIRIGDTVIVQRAGDVIPEVAFALPSHRNGTETAFRMPERCPACNAPVIRLTDEAVYRCQNGTCPAVVKESIRHFASRPAMDIDGLGERLIDQLVDNGLISSPADLYDRLTADQLQTLRRMAETSAAKLLSAIQQSKQRGLERLLFALGIRHVGRHTAAMLARHFNTLDRLRFAGKEDLLGINQVGPEVADSVYSFFRLAATDTLLERLRQAGVRMDLALSPTGSQRLKGKKFVFTGTLQRINRSEAAALVIANGGSVMSSVSSQIDYVICGDDAGSKLRKARTLGIPILDEDGFSALLNES